MKLRRREICSLDRFLNNLRNETFLDSITDTRMQLAATRGFDQPFHRPVILVSCFWTESIIGWYWIRLIPFMTGEDRRLQEREDWLRTNWFSEVSFESDAVICLSLKSRRKKHVSTAAFPQLPCHRSAVQDFSEQKGWSKTTLGWEQLWIAIQLGYDSVINGPSSYKKPYLDLSLFLINILIGQSLHS